MFLRYRSEALVERGQRVVVGGGLIWRHVAALMQLSVQLLVWDCGATSAWFGEEPYDGWQRQRGLSATRWTMKGTMHRFIRQSLNTDGACCIAHAGVAQRFCLCDKAEQSAVSKPMQGNVLVTAL